MGHSQSRSSDPRHREEKEVKQQTRDFKRYRGGIDDSYNIYHFAADRNYALLIEHHLRDYQGKPPPGINSTDKCNKRPADIALQKDHGAAFLALLLCGACPSAQLYTFQLCRAPDVFMRLRLAGRREFPSLVIPDLQGLQALPVAIQTRCRQVTIDLLSEYLDGIKSGRLAEGQLPDYDYLNDLLPAYMRADEPSSSTPVNTYDRLQFLGMLVEAGFDLSKYCRRHNALLHSTVHADRNFFKFLVDKVDVNDSDDQGMTPLLAAVEREHYGGTHIGLARMLIEAGADVSAINGRGESLLFLAVQSEAFQAAKDLIKAGCNPDVQNCDGKTALHVAASADNDEICKLLLDKSPMLVSMNDAQGRTALHCNIQSPKSSALRTLLDAKATISAQDRNGDGALLLALQQPFPNSQALMEMRVNMLIEAGADLNQANAKGQTAFHWSLHQGQWKATERLLCSGAVPNPPAGESPADILPIISALHCCCLQVANKCPPDATSPRPRQLHGESRATVLSLVDKMLECSDIFKGLDQATLDEILLHAVCAQHKASTLMVLQAGANPLRPYGTQTLLKWAWDTMRSDVYDVMIEHMKSQNRFVNHNWRRPRKMIDWLMSSPEWQSANSISSTCLKCTWSSCPGCNGEPIEDWHP